MFTYDKINCTDQYLNNITSILDKGMKFVPSIINNEFEWYNDIYSSVDNALVNLNKWIFFEKNKKRSKEIIEMPSNEISSIDNQSSQEDSTTTTRSSGVYSLRNIKKAVNNIADIPVCHETIELRKEILKSINKYNESMRSFTKNLSDEEIKTLKDYCFNKPFKILRCDKNVGTMIISNENEEILANKILNDLNTYQKLEYDKSNEIINEINLELTKLYENGNLNKTLYDKLFITDEEGFKSGKLKVMPKIHKKDFGVRQIISSIDHPTSKLCKVIDIILNPFVKSIRHILKDSQQLLQETEFMRFKVKLHLYSCDFESLYSNIKPEHAIEVISNYIWSQTDLLKLYKLDLLAFKTILKLIFKCNIFSYNGLFFLQKIGIPMGCIAGPVIANTYIYILEKGWVIRNPNLIYYRFIDDIFIASPNMLNINEFKSIFLYLKLNIENCETVVFLDLEISFDTTINKLHFSLYIKPTNTFGYLLPSSNHPKHIFDNIPSSLIKRIRKICSSYLNYLYHSYLLHDRLVKRGYVSNNIKSIIREVGKIERTSLLPYKDVNKSKNNSLKFIINYDISYNVLNSFIYKIYNRMSNDHVLFSKKNIMIINRMNSNIGNILINNFKLKNCNPKVGFVKCNNLDCICRFSLNLHFIKINNLFIPLKSLSNCSSKGCIYIIKCMKCNCFYIGETLRTITKRIDEHLKNIANFSRDLNKTLMNFDKLSEVAVHFNRNGHNIERDFRFCVFEDNVINEIYRKSIETDLINLFDKTNTILNVKKPSIYTIKYFTFQSMY